MKLFHEYENKYFELVSYLLAGYDSFTLLDVEELKQKLFFNETDFNITDTIFSKKEREETLFFYGDGKFIPLIDKKLPVRSTENEIKAAIALCDDPYAEYFLESSTIKKLKSIMPEVESDLCREDIIIKNQFKEGAVSIGKSDDRMLIRLIAEAIKECRAIVFDNIKPGVYEFLKSKVFPVKIEYSFVNDQFRIISFDPKQGVFIKSMLSTMSSVEITEEVMKDIGIVYKDYLHNGMRTVVLDVEPVRHVIERCFRIFSYYDRKAEYNKEDNIYRLQINYHKDDEAELIRDIMSLGSSVVVLEPKSLQEKVFERIKCAMEIYG